MTETTHRQFFGDREREFVLTPALIVELERTTGTGIGALFRRLAANEFRHLIETVRLGLIGGGASPEEAHALVAAYVAGRPILEAYPLALSILEALFFGGSREQSTRTDEAAT
jgi:hypothetical protein